MPLPLPSSLSPSKVSSFTNCALSFRFSAIDRLPEPPSVAATRGSLVHAALERLFCLEPAERDIDAALRVLADAAAALPGDPECAGPEPDRQAERPAAKECDRRVRSRWSTEYSQKTKQQT